MKKCVVFSMLIVAAAAGSGCDRKAASSFQPPPPEVTVVTVRPQSLPAVFEYVGQTAGSREIEVRSRISGILESWNYDEGTKVEQGQSLFTIDPAPFRVALSKAKAELARAEANFAQAANNALRLKALWEARASSQKDYDDAVFAEQATAAAVQVAKAAVNEADLNLSYTRVEAPISGLTSRALKSEGSLVEAYQTLLTIISQIDPMHVIFNFTEAEHLKITHAVEKGSLKLPENGEFDVTLILADGSEHVSSGKVDFTDVRVDPSTGTIQARALVPNPQHKLRPGQFVRVRLSGAMRTGAIAVPQRAVMEGPTSKMVLVVNEKEIAEMRPVEVGDWSGENWVISSGLNSGDRVIVDGIVKARAGSPVKAVTE